MEKKEDGGSRGGQKVQGFWERRTQDRRWGQNQLFGSFRVSSGVPALNQGDPTDSALAAIASILEEPANRPIGRSIEPVAEPLDEPVLDPAFEQAFGPLSEPASEPSLEAVLERVSEAVSEPVFEPVLDPASEPVIEPAGEPIEDALPEVAPTFTTPAPIVESPSPTSSTSSPSPSADDGQSDTYVKLGPGPLDAIRFKWSARPAGDGQYFVDETIGVSSRSITLGPMPKEEAIRVIDERENDARRRFEALRNEMTAQGSSVAQSYGDSGEK